MIVSAILSHIGAVVTFGIVAAVTIVAMMAATTTVKAETALKRGDANILSDELEDSIARITASGNIEEAKVREIVRLAVKLGSVIGSR